MAWDIRPNPYITQNLRRRKSVWDAAEGVHLFPQYSKMKLKLAGLNHEAKLEIKKLSIASPF